MKDFFDLRIYNELKSRKNCEGYIQNLTNVISIAEKALSETKIIFSGYTDHGIHHSYNVAEYMDDIIGENISMISSLELYIIVVCALLHDLGMIVSEAEKDDIISGRKKIFRYGSFNKVKEVIANGDESIALQYIIRKAHGDRVREKIEELFFNERNLLRDNKGNPISNLVSLICESHQRSTDFLMEKFSENYQLSDKVDALYISALLRIADLLDISSDRALENIYRILRISEDDNKREHWLKNMAIFSGKKIEKSDFSEKCCSCNLYIRKICLYGFSYEEYVNNYGYISIEDFIKIQCEILNYKSYIEKEILACNNILLSHSDKNHQLYLSNNVKYLLHGKYREPNYRIDMNYDTIVDLLLGKAIYGDSRVGLREIIQNGMDACKYKVASLEVNDLMSYNPTIVINYIKSDNSSDYDRVEIYDAGIGMDKNIIENYFLNIGKSLYMSEEYKVSDKQFLNAGCYGIGFFSSFMLSGTVDVYSKLWGTKDVWHVTVEKNSRYACIEKSDRDVNGTIVSLKYDDFKNVFPNKDDVKYFIEGNFLSNIANGKKVMMFIRKDEKTEKIELPSINDVLINDKQKLTVDFSKYLSEIDCKATICKEEKANWFMFSEENGKVVLKKCSHKTLKKYKEITYMKLFFGNSFIFVPPELNPDPFMYNGDRQRSFNLLSERILNGYDYCLKNFLDDNGFAYPPDAEVPPAYIGKFNIETVNNDVYFIRKDVHIDNPEPNGGVILVGETYFDTVYVRNVRIPKFNIKIPDMIYMANNIIMPKISKILINILKEGVNPVLDRCDMEEKDKISISYAIGKAILLYYSDSSFSPKTMKTLIKRIYKDVNDFILK